MELQGVNVFVAAQHPANGKKVLGIMIYDRPVFQCLYAEVAVYLSFL